MTTERRLTVRLGQGVHYLDLARLYAAANHRMMPQNMTFEASVSIDTSQFAAAGQDVAFSVDVLPTTWPVYGAYKHGRKMYEEAMKPEIGTVDKARWNDFRICFDIAHANDVAGGTYSPLPLGVSYNQNLNGEYQYSVVLDDSFNTYRFAMLGGSALTGGQRVFGMLDQYDRKDDTDVDSGNQVTEYSLILNDQNDANANELIENGNLPPYNKDNLQTPIKTYHLHAYGSATNNVGYTRASTGNIDVPFGLLKVANLVAGDRDLIINFKAGSFKGISAVKA